MSKAEKFISHCTRNCSNEFDIPWLTPNEARKAVEIAREEIIEKTVRHIIFNTRIVHYNNYDTLEFNKSSLDDIINDLKQAMKDE